MSLDFSQSANEAAPPTRAHIVLGLLFPLHILVLITVSARVLVKAKLGKLGVEDLLIVIAASIALALLILTAIACLYGFGLHMRDMQPELILTYTKIRYASNGLWGVCFGFTKVSMLFFYLRFATERYFRIMCYTAITVISLSCTAILFVNLFGCTPISGSWDFSMPATCIDRVFFYYYSVISNMAIDILLMVLPIPILVGLQLSWRVKLSLVAIFSMGFLISGFSAMSLWALTVAIRSSESGWDGAYSWMWSMLELNVGVLTACMPAVKLFVTWVRGAGPTRGDSDGATIGGGARGCRMRSRKPSEPASSRSGMYQMTVQSQEVVLLETGAVLKSTAGNVV